VTADKRQTADLLVRLAKEVGGDGLQREVATMLAVSELSGPITAVVGYVKRGKSTLVNQILGRELSPTGPLPETASAIAYQRSRTANAAGFTTSLAQRRIAPRESAFRKACARAAAKDLVFVRFEGDVNLPDGINLVDTAGAGESSDAVQSLALGGTAEALLSVVDFALVVFGCPPGPEAAELEYLRRVTRVVGPERVRLVIKALDSSVDRANLTEWRDYLADFADLSSIAAAAFHISDQDPTDIRLIRRWLSETASTPVPRRSAVKRAQRQIMAALERLDWSVELDVIDEEIALLQPSLADALRPRTRSGKLRAAQAELDAEYERACKAYEAAYRSYMSEYTPLSGAHSSKQRELERYRQERDEANRSRKSDNTGTGCIGFFLLPLSFIFFPIGPIVVIVWMWASMKSPEDDSIVAGLNQRIAAAESELAGLTRQLELLNARKPEPPSPPARLAGGREQTSRRRQRRGKSGARSVP